MSVNFPLNKEKTLITRKKRSFTLSEAFWGYLFIIPTVSGLLIFYILPALASFIFSFTKWNGITKPIFIGLENFFRMFQNEVFLRSLTNTLYYTIATVPISIALATFLAVLLNQKIRGMAIFRTLFFIPVITMPIAVGMVWKWLYNQQFGLINYILGVFNLPQPAWLVNENLALISIILVSIWMTVGYNMVILLSGLQSIPSSFYEAASIDGAGPIRKFFMITLPLLTPSLFFVMIMAIIHSFQVFDLIFIMTNNEQALLDSTRTLVYSVWESGFKFFEMGYASAQALVLFFVIFVITLVQMYFQKKWVHYK